MLFCGVFVVVERLTREYFAHMAVKGYKIRAFKKKKILYLAKPPVSWSLVVFLLFCYGGLIPKSASFYDRQVVQSRESAGNLTRSKTQKKSFISDGAFNT